MSITEDMQIKMNLVAKIGELTFDNVVLSVKLERSEADNAALRKDLQVLSSKFGQVVDAKVEDHKQSDRAVRD